MDTEKLDERMELRLSSDLMGILKSIDSAHGITPQQMARKLLEQAALTFMENGRFSFPVEIKPVSNSTDVADWLAEQQKRKDNAMIQFRRKVKAVMSGKHDPKAAGYKQKNLEKLMPGAGEK